MALERRRNGQPKYYYTAKRVEGKVVKTYHGTGPLALLVEIKVRKIARERAAELKKRDDFVAELWHLESIGRLAKKAAQQAMYSTYLLAGYQRTATCYHWKRKEPRMSIPTLASLEELEPVQPQKEEVLQDTAKSEPEQQPKPPPKKFWPESIEETIKLVMSGRRDLLEHLRSQLADVPDLWRQVSDLTRTAIQGWAQKISKGNVAFRESIVLATMEERDKLLEEASTIMERAVIDRFIITKLALSYYDIVTACGDESLDYSKVGATIEQRYRSAEHQHREATRQLSKIKVIQQEVAPDSPAVASLSLYDPDSKLKRQVG